MVHAQIIKPKLPLANTVRFSTNPSTYKPKAVSMWPFKSDPAKKLKQTYQQKMEAAMHALRQGDVRQNAVLVAEAEAIKAELDAVEQG